VEYIPEGYYTCTSASYLASYNGCGDGVPSNGPPEVNAFNALLASNQRNGVSRKKGDPGYEACDDGGNASTYCSSDCTTITDGYECLEWGKVCTPKCGNGHVEGKPVTKTLADGSTVTEFEYELDASGNIREECDFGTYNSPNLLSYYTDATYDEIRQYACSKDCKLI